MVSGVRTNLYFDGRRRGKSVTRPMNHPDAVVVLVRNNARTELEIGCRAFVALLKPVGVSCTVVAF